MSVEVERLVYQLQERVEKLEEMAHVDDSAGTVIADACARLWEADPHSFSTRGCSTCRAVSGLLGRDFGCVAKGKVRT